MVPLLYSFFGLLFFFPRNWTMNRAWHHIIIPLSRLVYHDYHKKQCQKQLPIMNLKCQRMIYKHPQLEPPPFCQRAGLLCSFMQISLLGI